MLTNAEIKKQIAKGNITIENMRPNALDKPNSCIISIEDTLYSYDYMVVDTNKKHEFLQEVLNNDPKTLNTIKIPEEGFVLEPHKVYLARSKERITTKNYVPVLNGRASLSLLGLSIELTSGYGHEYFDNYFLLSIVATKPTKIYPNIEIGNLTFFESLDTKSSTNGMLSGEEIKRRMDIGDIIIDDKKKVLVNPNSINLTLHDTIGVYKDPILDLKKENNIEYLKIGEEGMVLYPNNIYLARTNEWTEINNLVPMISGRSSLGRVGFHAHCSASMGSIGYKGYWHIGIRPSTPIYIYKDMQCCQIYFYTVEGEITNTYQGSMQNLNGKDLKSKYYQKINHE